MDNIINVHADLEKANALCDQGYELVNAVNGNCGWYYILRRKSNSEKAAAAPTKPANPKLYKQKIYQNTKEGFACDNEGNRIMKKDGTWAKITDEVGWTDENGVWHLAVNFINPFQILNYGKGNEIQYPQDTFGEL